jgi:hypothetical protein
MSENNELKICYEKLLEIMDSMKRNRAEIDKIRNEIDDNIRLMIEIMPILLAQSDKKIMTDNTMTDNTYVLELKNDIQLLTHKIDLLQLNKFEYTASVPKHNEICSNVPEIKQTGQHSSGSLASEKSHIDEEKALDIKIVPSTSLNGGNQSATDVKAKTFSNDFIVEQYRSEVKKFVDDYNTRLLPTSSDIKLIVFPDDKKRLSKNNFDSWCEIEDIDKICLIETSGTYSYQAQRLNIDNGCGNQYFLVAPNMLISNFTKKTVVEDAYLAFFCFTNNAISEKGNRGKLIKPATFQKISSFYKLVSKGEIELL